MPAQVINAPSQDTVSHKKCVFLAGATTPDGDGDWRETLSASLAEYAITIFNPYRADWDSTWREDINFGPYREQVEWELEKQLAADLVVVYFGSETLAPISLLEFGLSAQVPGKVIAIAPEGYKMRGNVQIVCRKFNIRFLDNIDKLHEIILERLNSLDIETT
ncbi:hypothetical protein F5Y18DRAFT_437388 [Xylariaceae sp. FL1019]|nr:hypothetical protein F5Y18DRAFT_437388 [Xylariaceae sp. FL1019]